jgi:MoaA/NifB/PqqE/SkfB family radical SAM enzyme
MITDRIDNITKIPESYKQVILKAPKSVKIELSPRCNYRCGFCAVRTRDVQPKEDMDFALFQRITEQMLQAGVEEIGVFYLGESFMNPKLLISAIKHLKAIGMPYVFLTSNASLSDPYSVEQCMKAGLDSLKWSVNACDDEQFKEIMSVSPKLYKLALSNIKEAWTIRETGGYKTNLYASSIKYDGIQQEKMEQLLEEKVIPYVDQHYWLPLYSMGSLALQREKELGYRPIAGNQGRLDALREPLPCWSAFTEGHVTSQGHLSACCFDSDGRWTMADLNEVEFMTGWNSNEFQTLREAHLRKDVSGTICESCVAYT